MTVNKAATIAAALAVVAMAWFAVAPMARAQDQGDGNMMMNGMKDANVKVMDANKPMMKPFKKMAEMKEALQEAKSVAQTENATDTQAKIDTAMGILEEAHQTAHKCVGMMMEKIKEHKAVVESIDAGVQALRQELGEPSPAVTAQLDDLQQKVNMLKEMTRKNEKDCQMKCPVCGEMIKPAQGKQVSNAYCPIMGTKLDQANVPERLTRQFKGQTIGFCCESCPPAWDKLSDEQKEAKLLEARQKSM